MAFLFVKRRIRVLSNLTDSKNIVFSAEGDTVITRIVATNMSNGEIRVNMEIIDPFAVPIGKATFHPSVRIKKNGSRDLTIAMPDPDDTSPPSAPPPLEVPDGTNIIVYSDDSDEKFDCTITYQELNETEMAPGCT